MGTHTPAAEQRRLVARWRGTDASMAAFARLHGVRPTTFSAWVAQHRSEPPTLSAPPAFVQVTVPPMPPSSPELCVHVGEHSLRFDSPPPASWFAAVVRALSPC